MGIERQAYESSQKTKQNPINPRKKRKTLRTKPQRKTQETRTQAPIAPQGGKRRHF
jgi:hypothetical protein